MNKPEHVSPYYLYGLSKYLENISLPAGASATFLQDLGRNYYQESLAVSDPYIRQSFERQCLKLKGFALQGREVFEKGGRFYEALLLQYGGYLARLQASLASSGPPLIFLDLETNWYGEIRELAFLHTRTGGIDLYAYSSRGGGGNYIKGLKESKCLEYPRGLKDPDQGLEVLKAHSVANPYWVGHQIREHDIIILKNRGFTIPDDRIIDTLELSAIAHPLWPDLRLRCPHMAHEDVYQNIRLFISLVFRLQAKPKEVRDYIQQELPIFQTLWEIASFRSGPAASMMKGLMSPTSPTDPADMRDPTGLKGASQDLAPLYELRQEELIVPGYEMAGVSLLLGNNVVLKDRLPYCFALIEGKDDVADLKEEFRSQESEVRGKTDVALVGLSEHLLDEEKISSMIADSMAADGSKGAKSLGIAFIHSFFDECRSRKIPFSRYLLHPIPRQKWCRDLLATIEDSRFMKAGQCPDLKTGQYSQESSGAAADGSPAGTCTVYFLEELPFLSLTEQEFKNLKWPDRSSFYLSRMEWSSDSAEWLIGVTRWRPLKGFGPDEAERQKKQRINFLLHRSSRNWLLLPKGEAGTVGIPGCSRMAGMTGMTGMAGMSSMAGLEEEGSCGNFLWESGVFLLDVLTGEIRLYPHLEAFPWLAGSLLADSWQAASSALLPQVASGEECAGCEVRGSENSAGCSDSPPPSLERVGVGGNAEQNARRTTHDAPCTAHEAHDAPFVKETPARLIRVMPKAREFLTSPDSPYHHIFYTTLLLCLLQQVREGRRVVFLYDPEKCASRDPWPEMILFLKARSIRINMARSNMACSNTARSSQVGIRGYKPGISRAGIFRNLELLFQGKQEVCFFPATALPEVLEAFSFWQKAYPDLDMSMDMGQHSLPPAQRPILLLESLPFRIPLGYSLFAGQGQNQCMEQDRDIHSLELIFRKFRSFYLDLFEGIDSVWFFDYRIPDIETRLWPLPPDVECDADLREKVNQLFNPKAWEELDKPDQERDIDILLRNVFFREGEFSSEHYERTQKKNVEEFFISPDAVSPGADSKDLRHRLITLPTGGGKSLIFQLPAIIKTAYSGRLVLIISPLKALIQEQSFKLCSLGMFDFVAGFHQDLDREEVYSYYHQIQDGTLRIVYVTPERFRSPAFRKVLQRRVALDAGLEFVVFDEVHCVTDWGYHFRPDYLCCYQDLLLHEIYGRVQGFLFSATVTETNLRLLIEKIRHREKNAGCSDLPSGGRVGVGGSAEQNALSTKHYAQSVHADSTASTDDAQEAHEAHEADDAHDADGAHEAHGADDADGADWVDMADWGIKDVNPENRVPLRPEIEKYIFPIGIRVEGQSEKVKGQGQEIEEEAEEEQTDQIPLHRGKRLGEGESHRRDACATLAMQADRPSAMQADRPSAMQADRPSCAYLDTQAEKVEAIRKIIEDNLDAEHFRALIFYQSQHGTEELAEALNEALIKDMRSRKPIYFDCFHAGIPVEEREMIYRRFASGDIHVLVATRAFGMGMDIPNISLVIHYQRPQTLEDYLQEIGRAARKRGHFSAPACAYVLLEQQEMEWDGPGIGVGSSSSSSSSSNSSSSDKGGGSTGFQPVHQHRQRGEATGIGTGIGDGPGIIEQEAESLPDLTKEAVLNIRSELMEQVFKEGSLQEATFSMQFHGLEFRFDDRMSGISKFSPAPQKRRKEAVVRSALYWLSQYEAGIFDWGEYRLYGLEMDLTGDPSAFPLDKAWQRELRNEGRAVFSLQGLVRQYDGDERACYLDLIQFQRKGLITISHRSIQSTSFVLPARSEKVNPSNPSGSQPGDRAYFFPLFFPLQISLILFEKIQQKYLSRESRISWHYLVEQITALVRDYRTKGKVLFSEEEKNRIWGQESAELEELHRNGFWRTPQDRDHETGGDHEETNYEERNYEERDSNFYELDLDQLSVSYPFSGSYPHLEEWVEKHHRKMLHDLVKKSRRIGHLFRFWQRYKIMIYRTENLVEEKNIIFRLLEVNPKHNFSQDVELAEKIYEYLHHEYLHHCCLAQERVLSPCQSLHDGRLRIDSRMQAGAGAGGCSRMGAPLAPESFGILSIYEHFHQDHSLEEMKRALSLLKVLGYIHYFEQEEEIGYRLTLRPSDQWKESNLDRIREINQLVKVKEFLTRVFFAVLAGGDRELADQLIADYFTCLHSAQSPGFSDRTLALWQKPEHERLRLRIQKYFSVEKRKNYLEAKDRELDDEQKGIVETFSETPAPLAGESLIVRAGPGTGKTRTLIYAVLDLLIQKGVPPEHILLLSYTKKAVVELQKRIRDYQPQFDLLNDWKRLNIYTFHGFARKVLEPGEIVRISEEIRDRQGRGGKIQQDRVPGHSSTELFHQKCMERAAELFSARHYQYLLIDEFQDVLADRLEFVKKIILKSHRENLKVFLVGDPLQDIFHYQHPQDERTSFDLMNTFLAEQSIGYVQRELSKNYRSASELCRFFDEYVQENYACTRRIHSSARNSEAERADLADRADLVVQADRADRVDLVDQPDKDAEAWRKSGLQGGITRKVPLHPDGHQESHKAIYQHIAEDITCIAASLTSASGAPFCQRGSCPNLSLAILGRSNQEVEAAFYHLYRKLSSFGRCLPLNENFPLWRRWDTFETILDLAGRERNGERIDEAAIKAAFDRCRGLGMIPAYIGSYRDWEPLAIWDYLMDRRKGFADIRLWPEEGRGGETGAPLAVEQFFGQPGSKYNSQDNSQYNSQYNSQDSGQLAIGQIDGQANQQDHGRIDGSELDDYLIEEAPLKVRRGEIAVCEDAGENERRVEVIFSTVHKVKGLEFDAVYLLPFGRHAGPFPGRPRNKHSKHSSGLCEEMSSKGKEGREGGGGREGQEGEEKNIGYVGITRARYRVVRYLWSAGARGSRDARGAGDVRGAVSSGRRAGQAGQEHKWQEMPVVLSFPGRELISREFGLRFDDWRESRGVHVGDLVSIARSGDLALCQLKPQIVVGKVNPNYLKGFGPGPWIYRIRELYVRFYREEDPLYWSGYTEFLKSKINQGSYFLLPILERV